MKYLNTVLLGFLLGLGATVGYHLATFAIGYWMAKLFAPVYLGISL